jgi:hypothetical protein
MIRAQTRVATPRDTVSLDSPCGEGSVPMQALALTLRSEAEHFHAARHLRMPARNGELFAQLARVHVSGAIAGEEAAHRL